MHVCVDERRHHRLAGQIDVRGICANIDGFAHMFRDRDADADVLSLLRARPNVFFMVTLWAPRLAAMTKPPAWAVDPRIGQTASADQIREFAVTPFANRTAQSVATAQDEWKHLQTNVQVLGKAGVKLILGTDVGGNTGGPLLGWAEHVELENMVAAGMTPSAAIRAATRATADALQIPELGTIAPGKRADFLVLGADPLADIPNTRSISKVFQRGVTVR
jgi:hypothetical protein